MKAYSLFCHMVNDEIVLFGWSDKPSRLRYQLLMYLRDLGWNKMAFSDIIVRRAKQHDGKRNKEMILHSQLIDL